MTRVIDASVALKWFVNEDGHAAARALMEGDEPFAAPDLLLAEVGNVLWKKCRRGELALEQAREAIRVLPDCLERLIPTADLHERAFSLALALDHPVYDCLYLACAEAMGVPLVTADRRLCAALEGTSLAGLAFPLEASPAIPRRS